VKQQLKKKFAKTKCCLNQKIEFFSTLYFNETSKTFSILFHFVSIHLLWMNSAELFFCVCIATRFFEANECGWWEISVGQPSSLELLILKRSQIGFIFVFNDFRIYFQIHSIFVKKN
jgi:hypothetical protein